MLGRFSGVPGVVTSALVLLVISGGTAARADGTIPPVVLTSHRALSARVWGMGGACAALPRSTDEALSNPAGAILASGQQVIIGYLDADTMAALLMYDAPDVGSGGGPSIPGRDEDAPDEGDSLPSLLPAGPGEFAGAEDPRFAFARRWSPGSRWAWGAAGEAARSRDARLLELGLLYRGHDELSLGLKWDDLLVTGGYSVSATAVGAAYARRHWTVALDLCSVGGNARRDTGTLAGAEYRFDNGFALRVGSARGNLSYGIGYGKNDWSVDIARVRIGQGELLLPGTTLSSAGDFTFLSLTCSY